MGFFDCSSCGTTVSHADDDPPRRNTCFKCHVKTLSIGFTYGKENFHGDTIRQRQEETVRTAAAEGRDIQPVGNRWV